MCTLLHTNVTQTDSELFRRKSPWHKHVYVVCCIYIFRNVQMSSIVVWKFHPDTNITVCLRFIFFLSLVCWRWLFMRSIVEYYRIRIHLFRGTLKAHSLCVIVETCVLTNIESTMAVCVCFFCIKSFRRGKCERNAVIYFKTVTGSIQHTGPFTYVAYIYLVLLLR